MLVLVVHCEALLALGDVTSATPAVRELSQRASAGLWRLVPWAACFEAELANLTVYTGH